MTTPSRHPDDATLFDFAAGALDTKARAVVQQHLTRCAACSAFIAASNAGAAALADVVEPMPEPASTRLRLALDDEWSALHAGERAAVETAPLMPARSTRVGRERRSPARTWRRRAVPVLAFAVIAALAGVSFTLVDDPASTPRPADSSSAERTTAGASNDATSDGSSGRPEPQAQPAEDAGATSSRPPAAATAPDTGVEGQPAAAPADGRGAATSSPDAVEAKEAGAALDAQVATGGTEINPVTGLPEGDTGVVAPIEYDPETGLPIPVCVAGFDPGLIALPGNRYPATVIDGPLGVYVICG